MGDVTSQMFIENQFCNLVFGKTHLSEFSNTISAGLNGKRAFWIEKAFDEDCE